MIDLDKQFKGAAAPLTKAPQAVECLSATEGCACKFIEITKDINGQVTATCPSIKKYLESMKTEEEPFTEFEADNPVLLCPLGVHGEVTVVPLKE